MGPTQSFHWNRIMRTAQKMLDDPFLDEMRQRRDESGSKSPMGALDCALLYAITHWRRPRTIVETGGFLGMSTAFMLKAVKDAGVESPKVYSIELLEEVDQGCLIPDRLRAGFIPLAGRVENYMKSTVFPKQLDMFIHDSSHRLKHMLMEYKYFWNLMGDGGLLVSHDVNMSAAFPQFLDKTYVHDSIGQTDIELTTHSEWGRWGNIGFILKQETEAAKKRSQGAAPIARPKETVAKEAIAAKKVAAQKQAAAQKIAVQKQAAAKKAAAQKQAAAKKAWALMTPAQKQAAVKKQATQKQAAAKKAWALMTPAQKQAAATKAAAHKQATAKKAAALVTPAQKQAAAKKAAAQKQAAAKKAAPLKTPAQKQTAAKKAAPPKTPAQKQAAAKKAAPLKAPAQKQTAAETKAIPKKPPVEKQASSSAVNSEPKKAASIKKTEDKETTPDLTTSKGSSGTNTSKQKRTKPKNTSSKRKPRRKRKR